MHSKERDGEMQMQILSDNNAIFLRCMSTPLESKRPSSLLPDHGFVPPKPLSDQIVNQAPSILMMLNAPFSHVSKSTGEQV